MTLYRVWADRVIVCFTEVDAESEEEAIDYAKDLGLHDLEIEFENVSWSVEELKG